MSMDAFGGTVSSAKVAILLPRSRYTLLVNSAEKDL